MGKKELEKSSLDDESEAYHLPDVVSLWDRHLVERRVRRDDDFFFGVNYYP
jgi:hypothetical protein